MNNAWMDAHELNAAADRALQAATEALGTPRFPLLLVEYQRAMEQTGACRLALRMASPERAKGDAGRIPPLEARA